MSECSLVDIDSETSISEVFSISLECLPDDPDPETFRLYESEYEEKYVKLGRHLGFNKALMRHIQSLFGVVRILQQRQLGIPGYLRLIQAKFTSMTPWPQQQFRPEKKKRMSAKFLVEVQAACRNQDLQRVNKLLAPPAVCPKLDSHINLLEWYLVKGKCSYAMIGCLIDHDFTTRWKFLHALLEENHGYDILTGFIRAGFLGAVELTGRDLVPLTERLIQENPRGPFGDDSGPFLMKTLDQVYARTRPDQLSSDRLYSGVAPYFDLLFPLWLKHGWPASWLLEQTLWLGAPRHLEELIRRGSRPTTAHIYLLCHRVIYGQTEAENLQDQLDFLELLLPVVGPVQDLKLSPVKVEVLQYLAEWGYQLTPSNMALCHRYADFKALLPYYNGSWDQTWLREAIQCQDVAVATWILRRSEITMNQLLDDLPDPVMTPLLTSYLSPDRLSPALQKKIQLHHTRISQKESRIQEYQRLIEKLQGDIIDLHQKADQLEPLVQITAARLAEDQSGVPIWYRAAQQNDVAVLSQYLRGNPDLSYVDETGQTVLHVLVRYAQDPRCLEWVVSHRPDMTSQPDAAGRVALSYLMDNPCRLMILTAYLDADLLAYPTDRAARNQVIGQALAGTSILFEVIREGLNVHLLELLLYVVKVDVYVMDNEGKTAFDYAEQQVKSRPMRLLINQYLEAVERIQTAYELVPEVANPVVLSQVSRAGFTFSAEAQAFFETNPTVVPISLEEVTVVGRPPLWNLVENKPYQEEQSEEYDEDSNEDCTSDDSDYDSDSSSSHYTKSMN